MDFIYYLPEILFGALALAAVIWAIALVRDLRRGNYGEAGCIHCRGTAVKEGYGPCLFLLPLHFGETYDNSEEYLRTHLRPIYSKDQIPTGMRACWLEVYRCGRCDKRQVKITDFLEVRGEENVERTHVFDYESFRPLIDQWREAGISGVQPRKISKGIHGQADIRINRRGEF